MPNITQALGHTFRIGSIVGSTEVDVIINVTKRRERILYRSSVSPNAANVGFVSGDTVSLAENLSIADRSTSIPANRIESADFTVTDASAFSINTDNFVVTDIFTDITNTIASVPLFYQHTLDPDKVARVDNGDLVPGWKILDLQLLDSFFQPINTIELKLDADQGVVYNNLLSEFDASSYVFYYVKYVVRDNIGRVSTHVDLLDNTTIFSLATIDDLTEFLTIIPGRKVYLLEEVIGSFSVTLPVGPTYAFQPTLDSRLRIVVPANRDLTDPWFVKVSNGKFFANIGGDLLKYHIAEFLSQTFDPEVPIKKVDVERSAILEETIIKTDFNNIKQDDSLSLFISILINDKDGNGLAAFTTDSSIVGNIATNSKAYVEWNSVDRVGIQSIDHRGGFIKIDGLSLKTNYEVLSSYYFEEVEYEFTLVDFNPINSSEALTTRTSLFIDPDTSTVSKSQTLFFLKSDETGKVVESNWPDFDNVSGLHIDGDPLYYEKFPTFLPSGDHHVFVSEFTVEMSGVEAGNFLILGDITVSEGSDPRELDLFDSRLRGGGIIKKEIADAKLFNNEVDWYWDEGYWDGIPYPGNASYLVEVPVSLLEGAGGVFRSNEIRDIVEQHTAAGIYPVTRAYGVELVISGVESTSSGIILRWFAHGS